MQTEIQTGASKKRGVKFAAKNTTALTEPSSGMRSTGKLSAEQAGDEADADGPRRRRRRRRGGGEARREAAAARIKAAIAASEYMTTPEAAAYLKISRQFLEAARYSGDGSGPPYIKLQRAVRYRRSALDAWMAAHDHAPDKPIAE